MMLIAVTFLTTLFNLNYFFSLKTGELSVVTLLKFWRSKQLFGNCLLNSHLKDLISLILSRSRNICKKCKIVKSTAMSKANHCAKILFVVIVTVEFMIH